MADQFNRHRRRFVMAAVVALLALPMTPAIADGGTARGRAAGFTVTDPVTSVGPTAVASGVSLTPTQKAKLLGIARRSWKFYEADVDPHTSLPMDNLTFAGGSGSPTTYGRYTSAANVGVYLWAVVAAHDLGLISRSQAVSRLRATLQTVRSLKRSHGFLYQWYDTTNGHVLTNPGEADCSGETTPVFDNCYFISNVDNGWYASGLVVARQALPELKPLVRKLMAPMDFGLFYDARPETHCNVNAAVSDQPTGQMYGGYYVGLPPGNAANASHYYHNGALYSDPRISAYLGMGLRQMPGNVWWRTWRTLPPAAPFADCQDTDPDNSGQGQWPAAGYWKNYRDPQSGRSFKVWEGHYTYPGTALSYIPTFGGGMFEALMADQVVPETTWGPTSFGLADVRTVQVQIKYATEQLHYPVWGMSPSSTADDTGDYGIYGVEGLTLPFVGTGADAAHPNSGLSLCHGCATEDVVTPHASFIALDALPQQAYANIRALRTLFPDVYGPTGFYDAVNPATGAVGHRELVLDQSMIMASIDNAVNNRTMQRHFASDPVSWAARTYLSMETMSLG